MTKKLKNLLRAVLALVLVLSIVQLASLNVRAEEEMCKFCGHVKSEHSKTYNGNKAPITSDFDMVTGCDSCSTQNECVFGNTWQLCKASGSGGSGDSGNNTGGKNYEIGYTYNAPSDFVWEGINDAKSAKAGDKITIKNNNPAGTLDSDLFYYLIGGENAPWNGNDQDEDGTVEAEGSKELTIPKGYKVSNIEGRGVAVIISIEKENSSVLPETPPAPVTSPKTGDSSNAYAWITLLVASMGIMTIAIKRNDA